MGADEWSTYLQSEEGYESFEGASDARATIWRSRVACSTEGMCQCAISPYTIRDWYDKSNYVLCFRQGHLQAAHDKVEMQSARITPMEQLHSFIAGTISLISTNYYGFLLFFFLYFGILITHIIIFFLISPVP